MKKQKEKAAYDRQRSKQLKEEYHKIANMINTAQIQEPPKEATLTQENLK